MSEDSQSRSYQRQVSHVKVAMHSRGHLDAEGIELHANTGEFGDAFGKVSAGLVACVATGALEVLKRAK